MPLRTEKYTFESEVQRIEGEIDDLNDAVDGLRERAEQDGNDIDENAAAMVLERIQQFEYQLRGVRWARDEAFEADYCAAWDDDVDAVTVGGLTGGEFGKIQDDLAGTGEGAARVYQVEAGTVEAPYIDDSMDKDQRIATVSGLPVHYLMWAEARIDSLTGLGNENVRSDFEDLLEGMSE